MGKKVEDMGKETENIAINEDEFLSFFYKPGMFLLFLIHYYDGGRLLCPEHFMMARETSH